MSENGSAVESVSEIILRNYLEDARRNHFIMGSIKKQPLEPDL